MVDGVDRRKMIVGTAAMASAPWWLSRNAIAQEGDTLRIRVLGEAHIFDPAFFQHSSEHWVMDTIFPKLIMFKAGDQWEWELYSANSVEAVDPKTVTFKLKEGMEWTNGYGEVTAEDVKFSYERFNIPELKAPNAGNWRSLDHVEVTGKHSGTIHLKEPFAGLFGYVLPHDGGQIVCKKAVEKAGGKFGLDVPASAGPYNLVEVQPGQKIILERNASWKGPQPAFARIEMLSITDTKTAENAMLAGDLDWAIISNSTVPTLKDNLPGNLTLEIKPTPNIVWLGTNMANEHLKDIRVRKAIQLAVDRDAILKGAYFGVAEPANGLAAKGMLGYKETPFVTHDVEAAKKLIEEAGASGMTLDLDVAAETDKITAAQIIQANLAEIGIKVNINELEEGAYWSVAEEKGKNLQLFLGEWTNVPPDLSWMTQWFLPEQVGVWNWQHFVDEEFKRLHYAALSETDRNKRDELLKQAQSIVDNSYTAYVFTHVPRPVLYNSAKVVPAMKADASPRLDLFKKA